MLSRSGRDQDYRIDKDVMQKLKSFTPLILSSTSLEEYDLCHFKYFCEKCMKLLNCEKIEMDARVAGELTHECFCSIMGSRTKKDFISLSYDELNAEIAKQADIYKRDKLAGDFGKNARFGLMFNKLTDSLSAVFLHTQQSLMASDFIPEKYELDIRKQSPVKLKFGKKYELVFGGIIDRVDTCNIGGTDYIRIVDYKSSRKNINPVTLASGINLQMLLYLFAATEKGGAYSGFRPAGVLYSPVRIGNIKLEEHKIDTVNEESLRSELKTSGLVLDELAVLRAMEKDIAGNYIPVKLTKEGIPDKHSSCISGKGMERLRAFTYDKLREMAESLLEGNAEAEPLVNGSDTPCDYCSYADICGNSTMSKKRVPDAESIAEAERILGKDETNEGGED